MKRVLAIAAHYPNAHQPLAGIDTARQFEALAARGDWDVTVLAPVGVPPLALGRYRALARAAVTDVMNGVTVHRPRLTRLKNPDRPAGPKALARAALPLARRLHALAPFDVVDAPGLYPDGPAAARVAAKLGVPLSVRARGPELARANEQVRPRREMHDAADEAAGLLAESRALAAELAGHGFPAGKITVLYPGLDRTRFRLRDQAACRAELARAFGLSLLPGAPLLVTAGALTARNGQHYVLRALARLPSAHLVLVGSGPDRAALGQVADDSGMAGRVHFVGALGADALPVALAAADAMVLPSLSEGIGSGWIEALACGCPLVIADTGGAREVVVRPEAGRIVARHAEAIADAVRALLAQPPPREAVAACAERYGWDENAEALADYYEGLLERAPA